MQLLQSKQFKKDFAKLPKNTKIKAIQIFERFINNPHDPILRTHALAGKWRTYNSINITGDIRAVYVMVDDETAHFVAIGSHSKLYG